MKNRIVYIALGLITALLFSGCGERVPPNEVALVLKSLGERDAFGDSFSSELITGKRAPIATPGTVVLRFPLGVQSYAFTKAASYESPTDESMAVDAVGGVVKFDVAFHMRVMRELSDVQLKQRLITLMQDYQLRQYAGGHNALAHLLSGRFMTYLKKPFTDYCAKKQILDIVRSKQDISDFVRKELNERFNPLGLEFTMVGIISATDVGAEQQEALNRSVIQDINLKISEINKNDIQPLQKALVGIDNEKANEINQILNEANAKKIGAISIANQTRAQLISQQVGKENYVKLETLLTMQRILPTVKTKFIIVPNNATLYLNNSSNILPLK